MAAMGGEVTELLARMGAGEAHVLDQLLVVVHSELRRQAARYMRRERSNHTLQPTALVNEAFLRLVDQRDVRWQNRAHFFGVAAQAMRRVLIDHAKARHRFKRGGVRDNVTLDEGLLGAPARSVDLLDLDEALTRLELIDKQQARVVELRFFGGLSVEEAAEVMRISPATIKREWSMAKAWLYTQLSP
jgi:RNA polymerase sigma factor (TIGR02999 family)